MASDRLCLLEEMISEMNFLQSTHTSMVAQSSVSSGGSSSSSHDLSPPCFANLNGPETRGTVNYISMNSLGTVLLKTNSFYQECVPVSSNSL